MAPPSFAKIPLCVFRDAGLTLRELRVLGVLCAFADARGVCWPSRAQVGRLAALPVKRVSEVTGRLAARGWLRRTWRHGRRAYQIVWHGPVGAAVETVTSAARTTVPTSAPASDGMVSVCDDRDSIDGVDETPSDDVMKPLPLPGGPRARDAKALGSTAPDSPVLNASSLPEEGSQTRDHEAPDLGATEAPGSGDRTDPIPGATAPSQGLPQFGGGRVPNSGVGVAPDLGDGAPAQGDPQIGEPEAPGSGDSLAPKAGDSRPPNWGPRTDQRTNQGTDQEQSSASETPRTDHAKCEPALESTAANDDALASTPADQPTPRAGSPKRRRARAALNATQQARFARFWAAWPRRVAKGDALKAWQALDPDDALTDRIVAAVEQARQCRQWRQDGGRFIPYPATWLRRLGWEDDLNPDIVDAGADVNDRRGRSARRMQASVDALRTVFGESHGTADLPTGDGLPGRRLRR